MQDKLVGIFNHGAAELSAYARYGMQDFQQRVMGEYASGIPSQAYMLGSVTARDSFESMHPKAATEPAQNEPSMDEILDRAAQEPAPDRSRDKGMDMG
jgi:hypothetical protein